MWVTDRLYKTGNYTKLPAAVLFGTIYLVFHRSLHQLQEAAWTLTLLLRLCDLQHLSSLLARSLLPLHYTISNHHAPPPNQKAFVCHTPLSSSTHPSHRTPTAPVHLH